MTDTEEQINTLQKKYERILEDKQIFDDAKGILPSLEIILSLGILFGVFVVMVSAIASLVSEDYSLIIITSIAFVVVIIIENIISKKISKIKRELELYANESDFLVFFEAYKSYKSYIEASENKKPFLKEKIIEDTYEIVEIIKGWNAADNPISAWIMGKQISLFKDNISRLLLPNVASGTSVENEVLHIFRILCQFILDPNLDGLEKLNELIGKLPYLKYENLSSRQKAVKFLYSKPTLFRVIFGLIITVFVISIILIMNESVSVAFIGGMTSFWGAISAFDKLIKTEKPQQERLKKN